MMSNFIQNMSMMELIEFLKAQYSGVEDNEQLAQRQKDIYEARERFMFLYPYPTKDLPSYITGHAPENGKDIGTALTDAQIKNAAKFAVDIMKHPMFGKFPADPIQQAAKNLNNKTNEEPYQSTKGNNSTPKPQVEPKVAKKRKIVFED